MKPPVLLCYNLQGDQATKIKLLAMRLGVRIRAVSAQELGEPLVALCGWEPLTAAPPAAEPFTDAMLVLANFPQATLNAFLAGFREHKIPAVPLKAILTESNARWDSIALHRELGEEHRAMAAMQKPVHAPAPEEP